MMATMLTEVIGKAVLPVENWNPRAMNNGAQFTYIDISSIDRLSKSISQPQLIACAEAPSRARQLVTTNDVLVSTVRPNLNSVALVSEDLDGATASTGFCVLRPNPDLLDPKFLYYWVTTPQFIRNMTRLVTGQNYPAISDAIIKNSLMPFPPLKAQKWIAVILDKVDSIRSKKRQAIRLANQLIESGFLHFFGDCLNNGKSFSTGTLEQLAGRIVDCPHSTPQYSETETGYFCVRSSDIQDAQVNLSQTRFVTSEIYEERVARHVPQEGEVIYTREGGRLGNAAQIPRDVNICLGQRMMLFSAKDKVSTNEFIWTLLNSPGIRHQVDSLIAGAAAPRVNIADIRRLEVILPPFELQQHFSCFVQKVRDQRMKSSKSEDELGDLFNSLVQRAFRGEL